MKPKHAVDINSPSIQHLQRTRIPAPIARSILRNVWPLNCWVHFVEIDLLRGGPPHAGRESACARLLHDGKPLGAGAAPGFQGMPPDAALAFQPP